ncbi:hypothetical protein CVT24_011112 [Panaeolus cyanescens]|uniref:Uncharacterized protein n=1 Tax=Panaeolus cyanescens TaxID=181874 RepID=A0A409YG86_9AGAR|nr:hypothetical protein CVT24_011112 [Panaeolus cyanescens]
MVPSSLLEPLRHNKPPTSSEISQVEQFRNSINKATKVNQEERRLLLQELERLDKIEEKLQKQIQVCDVILSPIRHLPDDIIYEIATTKYLLPDKHIYTDPRTHTPSIFAQVCRSWRNVLHSIPRLWGHIRIECSYWNYQPVDALLERIKRFYHLSHPLNLSVYIHESSYVSDAEEALRTLPILFGDKSQNEIPEAGVPPILKWLFGSWSEARRLPISLHLDVPLLMRHLHVLTNPITDQRLQHQSQGIDALYLHQWKGSRRWLDLDEDAWDIQRLLAALPDLRCLWISELDARNFCRLFPSSIPNDLRVCNNLRFLYIGDYLRYREWLKVSQFWPRVEAAWVCLELVFLNSITTDPGSTIRHNHMKVLNMKLDPRNRIARDAPLVFPLFNVRFPSLQDLNLYFVDLPGVNPEIELVKTDLQQAFPCLTKVTVYITWTPLWPQQNFASLLKSFMSLSTSITLVVTVWSKNMRDFVFSILFDQNRDPNMPVLVQPNRLVLYFQIEAADFSDWMSPTKERLIKAISRIQSARSQKCTLFHVNYFDMRLPSTSSEFECQDRELEDAQRYWENLQSTIATLVPIAGVLYYAPVAHAWGAVGHEIVATIAQMHLHPDVLPTLCEILDLSRRDCHLSRVATWADQNRNRMRWSASLHYVGAVNDDPPEVCVYPGQDGWAGSEHINVLDGVKNTTALLEGWVRDEVNHHTANEALKFLIHFVGDMHQPLHLTGKLRGGNGAKVLFDRRHTSKPSFTPTLTSVQNVKENVPNFGQHGVVDQYTFNDCIRYLHSVWDGLLIAKSVRTVPGNYSRPLPYPQVERALRGTIYDPYIRRILWEGILNPWAEEVKTWYTCPEPTSSTTLFNALSSAGTPAWQQVMNGISHLYDAIFRYVPTGVEILPDGPVVCPYHWSKPAHQLNCDIVWPKSLALQSYSKDDVMADHHHDHDFDLGEDSDEVIAKALQDGLPQLDTPEYAGAIAKQMIVEKLLAQGGIRLAFILNYIFAPRTTSNVGQEGFVMDLTL